MKAGAHVIGVLLLGACAHSTTQPASTQTYERWQRVMNQVRADSIASAEKASGPVAPASEPNDAFMPAGVDLAKFELPIQYNEQVQHYIDLYAYRKRSVFVGWLRRMGRYRGYVEERLAAHGLPRELVYLPLIESGYDATATSSASAVGLWQFMAVTARSEGLEVSDFIDERRDPYRATDAAIRHLSGLHRLFGSWYLAAAAYNSGSGRVGRLLKETGRNKGSDDVFWELQPMLPQETKGYVPGLVAAAIIGEYPHMFGMAGEVRDAPLRFDTVTVPRATALHAVARAAQATTEEIRFLNPHYFRGMTPPDRESYVRVPVGKGFGFAAEFAKIPADERTMELGRTHIVRSGETLTAIARRYGTTVEALQKLNRIKRPSLVSAGRKLVIPSPDAPRSVYGTH